MTRRGPRPAAVRGTRGVGPADTVYREEAERLVRAGNRSAREIAIATGYSQRAVERIRARVREGREHAQHRPGCTCTQASRHGE